MKNRQINIRLSEKDLHDLKFMADWNQVTMSEMIRYLIRFESKTGSCSVFEIKRDPQRLKWIRKEVDMGG